MTSSRRTLRRRLVAWFSVPVIATGIVFAAADTAVAAPGDAAAVGFVADIHVVVEGGPSLTIDNRIGEVTAPPGDEVSLADPETEINVDLGPIIGPQLIAQAQLIEAAATSGPTGSAATAEVTAAEINTPGGILTIDAVASQVTCPVDGPATADVTPPATVTLNGVELVLDADGETEIVVGDDPNLATLTLTVDVQETTSETAAATAFIFGIDQNFPGLVTAVGTLTLAQSSCEAPIPVPSATTLDPDSGPTDGGTEVTITGTGFVPEDTTVTIGDQTVPASAVDVADDGTSLTFTTPPSPAGTVNVVVTTPGGSTDPLNFTYLAPAPPADAVFSGRVVTIGSRPIDRACIVVIHPDNSVTGPGVTDGDGRWRVTGLPNDTPLVVGVIPVSETSDPPCQFEGPPPAPAPGQLQPEFYRNVWVDLNPDPNNPLFQNPYAWAIEQGATTITNSTSGIDVCLTTDAGDVVPRPSCDLATPTPTPTPTTSTPQPTTNQTSTKVAKPPSGGSDLADTGGATPWLLALAGGFLATGTAVLRRSSRRRC